MLYIVLFRHAVLDFYVFLCFPRQSGGQRWVFIREQAGGRTPFLMGLRRGKSERDLVEFVGNVFLLRLLFWCYFVCLAVRVFFFSI